MCLGIVWSKRQMSHPFIKALWNANVCAKCAKPKSAHDTLTECQSCNTVSECEITKIDGKELSLCADCLTKHNEAVVNASRIETQRIERLQDLVNHANEQIDKFADGTSVKNIIEQAIQGNIKEYTDFFNAKMTPIVELEKLVSESPDYKDDAERKYALATILSRRIKYLSQVLFSFRTGEIELAAEVKSIQGYMNTLIPKLREDKRKEFSENDITYAPPNATNKTPKIRMTTGDKLVENYAKIMKVPIDVARRKLAGRLREECTCSETPGMCKVHNK